MPRSDSAASAALGLAVATVFVVGGFAVATLVISSNDGKDPRSSSLEPQAATALELLVREPGFSTGGSHWPDTPDAMLRFGLAEEGRPQFLDYSKVRALWNGSETADGANSAPDYEEVKEALGIEAGQDFHLRSYPVLMSIDDARWTPQDNLQVAYFAHYGNPESPATVTPTVTTTSNSVNVTISITNNGVDPMVYVAAVSLGESADDNPIITEERHTGLVLPGGTWNVHVDFWKLDGWDDDIDGVLVHVTDAYGNAVVDGSGDELDLDWITGVDPPEDTSSPKATYQRLVHASNVRYVSGQTVQFAIDHYDGEGDHVSNAKARFVLVGPNGKEWFNTTSDLSLPSQKNQVYTWSCPNCTTVGNYTGIAWDSSYKWRSVDRVHVSAAAMFESSYGASAIAAEEMTVLDQLVAGFDPTVYDPVTNPTGDVFTDDAAMADQMVALLDQYTTVVIGSEVEQANLAPEAVKQGLADWVSNEGGNLVVLGTYRQESRWLRSVWETMQETAGGGITAPDALHPVLTSPERLDHQRYLDRGRAWRVPEDGEFTHVLTRGESTNGESQDTLTVSAPGAFEAGTVVLTSYMPGSLTDPQDRDEAKRLLHNLLNQGHSMLFIDFGPPIPSGVPVGSASRLVVVPHPNVPDVEVEVRLVLYLFG